ncbi:hypothetical protein GA0061100_104566 [Rhizobium hainanense]|uniref:Uncharacterized protein n=1 Tax=Rhizobium hainanense TaxID=52131 RepID=A0A1C3V815_9HYPH|nr:hypothetical protein GA0061100_104566 [Rhizobium hainanense]
METKLANISDLPVTTGLPGVADADARLDGKHEIRLAKAVSITQFGVNLVTLDPGGHVIVTPLACGGGRIPLCSDGYADTG